MKKKYSTLLNFALSACLATTLVACGSDGDKTGSTGQNKKGPKIDIGGTVMDTNGRAIQGAIVSTQGESTTTNAAGQYYFKKLLVTNVAGADDNTSHGPVRVVIQPPDEYLGAVVSVYPEAQIDGSVDPDLDGSSGGDGDGGTGTGGTGGSSGGNSGGSGGDGIWWDGGDGGGAGSNSGGTGTGGTGGDGVGGDGGDGGSYTVVNPRTTFIDGMYVEAATAMLPMLNSEVTGVLRNCDTGEAMAGATVRLDMWAVDNNSPVQQADNDCDSSCYFSYEANPHAAITGDDGSFSFTEVPNDSILRMWAPNYDGLAVEDGTAGDVSCSPGDTPSNSEGDCIATTNEGLLYLGDVCVDPIPSSDDVYPCVTNVTGVTDSQFAAIYPNGHGVLHDNIDGTVNGIQINFTESLDCSLINANSIVIFNAGVDHSDTDDDVGYLDFTYQPDTGSCTSITINIDAADTPADDEYLEIFLLKDDFRDLGGNWLTVYPGSSSNSCDDIGYVDGFQSNLGTLYAQVNLKIFSQDTTAADAVTDLQVVCADDPADAGMPLLNAAYPDVFKDTWSDDGNSTPGLYFDNVNADPAAEKRLEGLADNQGRSDANIRDGYVHVKFMEPSEGTWAPDNFNCEDTWKDDDGFTHCVIEDDGDVNQPDEIVRINTLNDFFVISDFAEVTIQDCVAPTTVLNYAYNTCGYVTNDPSSNPYSDDNAAGICIGADVAGELPFCDGGENCDEELAQQLGLPTLNITCRLLKDESLAPSSGLADPPFGITLWDLYERSDNISIDQLYDATEFAAWSTDEDSFDGVSRRIGVAFSEDIQMDDGSIDWSGNAVIDGWGIVNNMSTTDDADTVDGGNGGSGDFAYVTIDNILTLANEDHGEIMDFSAAIKDDDNGGDNAAVVITDLLPPFIQYAYWNGGLVLQFNEEVDVDTTDDQSGSVDCSVIGGPTGTTSFVNLWDFTTSTYDTVYMNCATVSTDGTQVTIPVSNLGGITQADNFPPAPDPDSRVYEEAIYDSLDSSFNGPYGHGILNWDDISDVHGNTYDSDGNDWDDWQDGTYEDNDSNDQCRTPEFAIADVLGDFFIPTQNITNFATANNICPLTQSHVITYTFSHPLEMDPVVWPGVLCAGADCTVDEVNNATTGINNQAWVDSNVDVDTIGPTSMGAFAGLSGVGASLAADRLSMTITFANDCYDFQLGDVVDPDWVVFSTFGVGSGLNLNALVVAQ